MSFAVLATARQGLVQKPIDVPAGKGEIQSSFFLDFIFYLFLGGGLGFLLLLK